MDTDMVKRYPLLDVPANLFAIMGCVISWEYYKVAACKPWRLLYG